MKICFGTNNSNKILEINTILGRDFEILSLKDIGCRIDLPENQNTLEGNSEEKAKYVYNNFHVDCFADDTGLEVDALDGAPGVFSARYSGPQRNNKDNIRLLLDNLKPSDSRAAQFRTVITLIRNNIQIQFEGIVNGIITDELRGENGFGYDPVFIPDGYNKTFAELTMSEKNRISHRGLAFNKLIKYLQQNK